jgi:hypothetical protein
VGKSSEVSIDEVGRKGKERREKRKKLSKERET